MENKYFTTPIYYVNDKPHIGHAYTSISVDVLKRFYRLKGIDAYFLTGTDEHGQKVEKAAQDKDIDPKKFTDQVSENFRALSDVLNLDNDDFIRTTEERHKISVQNLWQRLIDNDEIYLSKYAGWYSVRDEAFVAENEITEVNGLKFNSYGSELSWVEEESYFFRLSKWQDRLLKFYESNPDFVHPKSRLNEVKSFVSGGLRDLSVSRTTFNWGIDVPNDNKHIMYVWLDALTNYISALGFPDQESQKYKSYWPGIHVVGKDILRFHAVYWPAFLMAANIPLPNQIFGHGWILSGDEKMSKSKGNILDPIELINQYGSDEIRYYLMKDVIFGLDGKINLDNFKTTINDLANNIGNLSNRIFTILGKNYNCKIPTINQEHTINSSLIVDKKKLINLMNNYEIHNYIKEIHSYSSTVNKYVNDNEPWNKKINSEQNIKNILFSSLFALRNIFILLYPIMPTVSKKFLKNINIQTPALDLLNLKLKSGDQLTKPELLFKKYE